LSTTVGIDQLGDAINKELTLYGDEVITGVKKLAKKSMSRLVKDTRATAPVGHRSKHYRDSITSKKTSEDKRSIEYTWYVKGSDYRLSHLLEKGHANRDGGRTAGTHFIQKASDPILEEYVRKVEEIIENG
jgi:hypothetical protein